MIECSALYPEDDSVHCFLDDAVEHSYHVGTQGIGIFEWRNPDVEVAPPIALSKKGRTKGLLEMARRTDQVRHAPRYRSSDPDTSRVAAKLIEPTVDTKMAKVLNYLRAANGQWVSGPELTTVEVGGSEGLKRVRELRANGWPIEREPIPGGGTTWRYRLQGNI